MKQPISPSIVIYLAKIDFLNLLKFCANFRLLLILVPCNDTCRLLTDWGWTFNVVGQINKVALRRPWLVLGWVTCIGFNSRCEKSQSNQPPRSTQPGRASVGRCNEYWPKGGDALWLAVKAGMVRVWWQVKLCEPLYNTCHIWAI